MLITSDGMAVACGNRSWSIPSPQSWFQRLVPSRQSQDPCVCYVASLTTPIKPKSGTRILQFSFTHQEDGDFMHFTKLSGEEQCSLKAHAAELAADVLALLRHEQGRGVEVVSPGGQLLSQMISQDPLTTLEKLEGFRPLTSL